MHAHYANIREWLKPSNQLKTGNISPTALMSFRLSEKIVIDK